MGQGERCAKCGHVVPYGVRQRCLAAGHCTMAAGDVASSSSPGDAGARRAPARARARTAKKKAKR